jgi:hypothetical protein
MRRKKAKSKIKSPPRRPQSVAEFIWSATMKICEKKHDFEALAMQRKAETRRENLGWSLQIEICDKKLLIHALLISLER